MIIFLVLCVFNGLCGAAPFTLVDTRSVGSNSITLRCRRTSDETFEPMAQYFRNGLGVHAIEGFLNTNNEPGIVTFQINRRLEGNYSCGTQLQRSYSIPFIAFPDQSPIPPTMPVYAIVGERARLRCGIQPGALTGQYYATWLNGTRTIYNYPAPSQRLADPSSQMTVDSRYSIDPSDLSLIITNVQLGDALQMYHCELGVEDPRSRNTHIYSLTRSHNISLKVLKSPQIIRVLPPNTIVAENEEVTFVCVALGFPTPIISWEHAGMVVTHNNPNFEVNSTTSQDGLTKIITSYLNSASASPSMNGEVKCIANPQQSGGRDLESVSTSTQMTVLGSFNNMKVQVTSLSDVVIIVELPRALTVPVHLYLVYTDLENPTRHDRRISQAAYVNTTSILHLEFASQVAFDHFIVQVGLYVQDVFGPLSTAPGKYDKDSPTIFEKIFTKETIVIIGVVPACTLIVLAVTIVIGVVLCSYYCAKYNNHHSAPDHYKDIVITALKFVDKEESPEIRKKIISSTDEIFLNTINFCKNEKKILCEKSSSRLPSKQNSTIDSVEDNDGPGELQPPSYESAIAEIDVEERNLRDQLTRHICDFVCLILNDDDYDPGIETTMVDSATERQTSTSANSQIEQREEQNIGIESTVADSATEIQTSR